jgi:hypothetical protein
VSIPCSIPFRTRRGIWPKLAPPPPAKDELEAVVSLSIRTQDVTQIDVRQNVTCRSLFSHCFPYVNAETASELKSRDGNKLTLNRRPRQFAIGRKLVACSSADGAGNVGLDGSLVLLPDSC